MKGAKVDAFFYPKTEGQKTDQQVFFKETAPRLEQRLKDALAEKKGLKWNLVYHCTLSMPSKYRREPMVYSPHFRTPHAITSTYPQQLREQLECCYGSIGGATVCVCSGQIRVDLGCKQGVNP